MANRSSTQVWIALVLWVVGCGGPAQLRYEEQVDQTPTAAVHAVHEERLRSLMRGLDGLRDERLPTALDPEVETERQAREIEQVARAMAGSARALGQIAPAALSPAEQEEFRALAKTLELQSDALADDARFLTPAQRAERLTEIDLTCGRCHGRFRIRGGSVEEH